MKGAMFLIAAVLMVVCGVRADSAGPVEQQQASAELAVTSAVEERAAVTPPSVAFYVSWASKNDPDGIIACGEMVTFSVSLSINPGSFQPSSVLVTNVLDPYTSLVAGSSRSSLGVPLEETTLIPNNVSISLGPLPAFAITNFYLTFDAVLSEYFSGVLVVARNSVYVQIDNWPIYSNLGQPDVFFTCQVNFNPSSIRWNL
jgi:hypothetical protein